MAGGGDTLIGQVGVTETEDAEGDGTTGGDC